MTSSHRGARAGELRILLSEYAPGKRTDLQFVDGSCQSAAEVIIGPGVAPWKSWTAVAQDGGDLTGRYAPPQQLFRDPFVGDAPVRLGDSDGSDKMFGRLPSSGAASNLGNCPHPLCKHHPASTASICSGITDGADGFGCAFSGCAQFGPCRSPFVTE